jgi:hypothetical protein
MKTGKYLDAQMQLKSKAKGKHLFIAKCKWEAKVTGDTTPSLLTPRGQLESKI